VVGEGEREAAVELPPRLVVAGTHSGVGKTTVASGLIAALRRAGHVVQGFKVGPDYIDPSFHAAGSGRPPRNLDPYLVGPELIGPLFAHGAAGAQLAVVEGVMGLFDGAAGRGELGSTAQVAKLLGAPVVLVVDGRSLARSAAALIHGYATFDPELEIAGVVINRVGSDRHRELLAEACAEAGVELLGTVPRRQEAALAERHLGLVPAGEVGARALERLADLVGANLHLARLVSVARCAKAVQAIPWQPPAASPGVRVGVAVGPAFSFHYQENLELLEGFGAELVPFDPLADRELPEGVGGLLFAGGYPELHAEALASNGPLRRAVAGFAAAGGPILAECGGLLYLGASLEGREMCGVVELEAQLSQRLTLGYREARAATPSPFFNAGETVRGHEFHYVAAQPPADPVAPAWRFAGGRVEGFTRGSVHASFLHLHWAAIPWLAKRFVAAARRTGRCS